MDELNVRIVELRPMRVASVLGYGTEPEIEAWDKLTAWAKPKGYLDDPNPHRIFGFDTPIASPGSPNRGYEFWIEVGPGQGPEGEFEIKEFGGGLYAVTRCEVKGNPYEIIPPAWKALVEWFENSPYQQGSHQCLEEHVHVKGMKEGQFVLDLYLPITKS